MFRGLCVLIQMLGNILFVVSFLKKTLFPSFFLFSSFTYLPPPLPPPLHSFSPYLPPFTLLAYFNLPRLP